MIIRSLLIFIKFKTTGCETIVYKKLFSITYYSIYLRRKGTTMAWERANVSLVSVLVDQLKRGWIKGSNECKDMYHS